MFNKFKEIDGNSRCSSRGFLWMAEYINGTTLQEYDIINNQFVDFYSIDKSKLIRFGLFGYGSKLYYEIPNGKFFLNNNEYEFIYENKDGKQYNLTGQYVLYNDIIQFKKGYTLMNPMDRTYQNDKQGEIEEYNFGYKIKLKFEDVNFNFQIFCTIPMYKRTDNANLIFKIKLVSDKIMDGKLVMRQNNLLKEIYDFPLNKGVGNNMELVVG